VRIGIDACTWSNRRGYGRFTRELVTAMVAEFPRNRVVLVVDQHTAGESVFPAGAEVEIVRTRKQPTQAASAHGSRSPLDLWKMGRAVSRLRLDVFFFPTRYSFYPLFCRTPTVVAFHDATAERHPELIFPGLSSRLLWRLKTWLALRRADRLVTVSQDARSQIAAVFRYPEAAIDVITEGPDPSFRPLNRETAAGVLDRYGLPSGLPLILYVGGISPHKNLQGLLEAMVHVHKTVATPWHLVLVGDYARDSFWGCHHELVELIPKLGLGGRVTFTGYVPDDHLLMLYNAATMLVLPSMSEGFGLPVVEAMACGLPVAVSNRNSLPEVVGSAGLLFDPVSTEEIARVIGRLLEDESLRHELRAKGLQRAQEFSWKAAAHKMVRILEDVGAGDGERRPHDV